MIELVIGGGQSGADQAGWRAAKAAGIPTGGWMPKGYLTEDGPRPEYAELYGAREHRSPKYPPRTRENVEWADATIVFAVNAKSPGSQKTVWLAYELDRPSVIVDVRLAEGIGDRPACVAKWIVTSNFRSLNVAGNRESKAPGIGGWVETYMAEVFRLLREGSGGSAHQEEGKGS